MTDVDGITETVFIDCDAADVTIGNRKNLLTLYIARLNVNATMKVPGTRLTEVTGQHYLVVDGTYVTLNVERWTLNVIITARNQQQ